VWEGCPLLIGAGDSRNFLVSYLKLSRILVYSEAINNFTQFFRCNQESKSTRGIDCIDPSIRGRA